MARNSPEIPGLSIKRNTERNRYLARVKSLNKVGVVLSLEPEHFCSYIPSLRLVNDDVAVEIVDINPEQAR